MPRPLLAVNQVLPLLSENPRHIASITAGLTTAQLHAIPGPDEWSANEVLAHLRACADVWGGCMKTIVDQDAPTIRAISPRSWIKRTNYLDLKFRPSFRAFVAQRSDLLAFLGALAPGDWSRSARVTRAGKVSTATVLSYAHRLAVHEQRHLDQFERIANTVRGPHGRGDG